MTCFECTICRVINDLKVVDEVTIKEPTRTTTNGKIMGFDYLMRAGMGEVMFRTKRHHSEDRMVLWMEKIRKFGYLLIILIAQGYPPYLTYMDVKEIVAMCKEAKDYHMMCSYLKQVFSSVQGLCHSFFMVRNIRTKCLGKIDVWWRRR